MEGAIRNMDTEIISNRSDNKIVIDFVDVLIMLLIILKINEVIDWSWIWVTSPIWVAWMIRCVSGIILCLRVYFDDTSVNFFEALSYLTTTASMILFIIVAVLAVMSLDGVMAVTSLAWWGIPIFVIATMLFISSWFISNIS